MTQRDLAGLALTLALGGGGGAAAHLLHLPLGWLLGSLLAVGGVAASGWRPFGQGIYFPQPMRMGFVPVIGVSIGGNFTPEVAREALGWGASLTALLVFIPLTHWVGYRIYRIGGLPERDAFFGAIPGGLIESVELGAEAGADVRLLTVLQLLRLILTVIAVPVIFLVLTGHVVGSASGVEAPAARIALTLRDVLLLILCGVVGMALARLARLPAWIITGPLILSALAHATDWVEGVPPGWLISLTQVMLGTGLGARFVGVEMALLRRGGLLAAVNGFVALIIAFGFALGLQGVLDVPPAAVFLAYAPGGLAEMSLIALSLEMSAIYVTAHHVVRIGLAVLLAQFGSWRSRR